MKPSRYSTWTAFFVFLFATAATTFGQAAPVITSTQTYTITTLAGLSSAGSTDGVGDEARFKTPEGVAADGLGNVFIADSENRTIRRIAADGRVTTLAGAPGVFGSSDGPGSVARFGYPRGIALDIAGNLYIADSSNHTIRKLAGDGTVTTLAGIAGEPGSADGVRNEARFLTPQSVTVDLSGNVYVADSGNHTIRKITADGVVTTLAGTARLSGNTDGAGAAARFFNPKGVAVDLAGNVMVADTGNYSIRKVTPDGLVTTLAGGTGNSIYPHGIAVNKDGTVYVADADDTYAADSDNSTVLKMTPLGIVAVLAGSKGEIGSADGPSNRARFRYLKGVAVDGVGNVLVADTGNNTIRQITADGVVATLAGNAPGLVDGAGSAARFNIPTRVAVDGAGNVYVKDSYNTTIRKMSPAGVVTTLRGGSIQSGTSPAPLYSFYTGDLAADGAGNVYVGDYAAGTIRKVTPSGFVSTLPGTYGVRVIPNPRGGSAYSYSNYCLAADAVGNVYVSDQAEKVIRKVTSAGLVTILAGAAGESGVDDGVGSGARFSMVSFLAVDGAGNVTVFDTNRVRRVTPSGVVTTLASGFGRVTGLAVDNAGNAFVSEGNAIRKVTPEGDVTTVAGAAGIAGNLDGPADVARFSAPAGLAVDGTGNLYIADVGNNAIRKGTVSSVAAPSMPVIAAQPASVAVSPGATVIFSVSAIGEVTGFQWAKDGVPIVGGTYATLVVAASSPEVAGNYACTLTNAAGSVTSSAAALVVSSTMEAARIVNFSIRSPVDSGARTLIVGLTIGGSASSASKPVLLRAMGPSLGAFGVSEFLADPKLELYSGGSKVNENDNWGGGAELTEAVGRVGAFSFNAPASKDSALYYPSLAPGGYTMVLTGVGNANGITLAEVYDATPASQFNPTSPRLVNVSARGHAGVGSAALIVGFVIGGQTSKTVLITGVGPGLAAFGLTGVLPDPRLQLYSGASLIQENDDWGGVNGAAGYLAQINSALASPFSSDTKAAALLVTLPPGAYSAHVSGVGGSSGVALVEVYEVQ